MGESVQWNRMIRFARRRWPAVAFASMAARLAACCSRSCRYCSRFLSTSWSVSS